MTPQERYMQAVAWEQQRAIALQNAQAQQSIDLQRLYQMAGQNQNYAGSLGSLSQLAGNYGNAGNGSYAPQHRYLHTGMAYATQTASTVDHSCATTCGVSGKAPEAQAQVINKKFLTEERPSQKPSSPRLSLKTTPLFGHLRWRFDSPFKPLSMWFVRLVLSHRRLVS